MSATAVEHEKHEEHHDHPSWLAHHFDDAEQQFDSGKLGMWLFLVTEVLFFSGMFCAYALLRSSNPEVFNYCSTFLNEKLGAINTGVLLFSSLTMAWAVRAAQLGQQKLLVALLGITLGCAAVFLGVKTVEYSHKWDLGLLPGRLYQAQVEHPAHHAMPTALPYLQAPGVVLAVLFAGWWLVAFGKRDKFQLQVAGPLFVAAMCYVGEPDWDCIWSLSKLRLMRCTRPPMVMLTMQGIMNMPTRQHTPKRRPSPHRLRLPMLRSGRSDALLTPVQNHLGEVQVSADTQSVPRPDVNQKGKAGCFSASTTA